MFHNYGMSFPAGAVLDISFPFHYHVDMEPILTEVRWPDEETGPWRVRLVWQVISRRWECVSFAVDTLPDLPAAPLRAAKLKADFPLGAIMERSRPQVQAGRERRIAAGDQEACALPRPYYMQISDKPITDAEIAEGLAVAAKAREQRQAIRDRQKELEAAMPKSKSGRPSLSPAHLANVARVYSDAYASGKPTKAVAKYFHVEHSTAATWIARCRDFGLLGKTEKGKAGGLPPEKSE